MAYRTKTYLYEKIADTLRQQIASGELQPGDRLPSVRDIGEQWGCTPGTVSRAYSLLAEEGLVTSYQGGGTRVTAPEGQTTRPSWQWAALINRGEQYLLEAISSGHSPAQAEAALAVAIARWRELAQQSPVTAVSPSAAASNSLRFVGSHDLLIEFVARLLHEVDPDAQMDVEYAGSLGGLMALAQGAADLAGIHLWDGETDAYNAPFVRRVLPGRPMRLVGLAYRALGLVVPPGNPQNLSGLAGLAKPGVRLVNRQSGSGTRVWLDWQLQAAGTETTAVAGYDHVVTTHLQVARTVADGEATAGLAIAAAGAAFGLDFIPLTRERYDLVIPQALWENSAVQTLVYLIRGDHFRTAVAALEGYDPVEEPSVSMIT